MVVGQVRVRRAALVLLCLLVTTIFILHHDSPPIVEVVFVDSSVEIPDLVVLVDAFDTMSARRLVKEVADTFACAGLMRDCDRTSRTRLVLIGQPQQMTQLTNVVAGSTPIVGWTDIVVNCSFVDASAQRSPSVYFLAASQHYLQEHFGNDRSVKQPWVALVRPAYAMWCRGPLRRGGLLRSRRHRVQAATIHNGTDVGVAIGPAIELLDKLLTPLATQQRTILAHRRSAAENVEGSQRLLGEWTSPNPALFAIPRHQGQDGCKAQCMATRATFLIDYAECVRVDLSPERFGDACRSNVLSEPYYHISRTVDSARVGALDPLLVKQLTTLEEERTRMTQSEPSVDTEDKCPFGRRNAILTLAFAYSPVELSVFVNSLLTIRDPHCTDLVLFVEYARTFTTIHAWAGRVVFVDARDFPRNITSQCDEAVDQRMELFRDWMRSVGYRKYGVLLFLDVRDTFFQGPRDPFVALATLSRGLRDIGADTEFVYTVAESFLGAVWHPIEPKPHVMFTKWTADLFGRNYSDQLLRSALATGEGLPVLCSGLFAGTWSSAYTLLDTMVRAMSVVRVCRVDQGYFTGAVFDLLRLAGYTGAIVIENGEYSVFRNGYADAPREALIRRNQLVNCDGVPYAVAQQLDRFPGLYHQLTGQQQTASEPTRQ